eukprot:3766461-Rhodomonas_salina.1
MFLFIKLYVVVYKTENGAVVDQALFDKEIERAKQKGSRKIDFRAEEGADKAQKLEREFVDAGAEAVCSAPTAEARTGDATKVMMLLRVVAFQTPAGTMTFKQDLLAFEAYKKLQEIRQTARQDSSFFNAEATQEALAWVTRRNSELDRSLARAE